MFAPTQLNGYQTPYSASHFASQHNERSNKVYRVLLHSENGIQSPGAGTYRWNDPLVFDVRLDDILLNQSDYQMAIEYFTLSMDDGVNTTQFPFAITVDGLALANSYDTKTNNRENILLVGNFGDGKSMIANTITPDTFGYPIGNLNLRQLKIHVVRAYDYASFSESNYGNTHGSWVLGLIFYPIK